MSETTESWEKRAGESSRAYAAFCVYRDLGPGRTLTAAYRQASGREKAVPPGQWTGWYQDQEWRRRADEYDAKIEADTRRERERAHLAAIRDYRARQRALAQATLKASMALLEKASKRLKQIAPDEIETRHLGNLYRAAAATANAASEAEGIALALDDLLDSLDADTEAPDSETSAPQRASR
jgi:hypothetical protein